MKNLSALLWQERINIALLILPLLAGALWWSRLPNQIPIHWNMAGEIDAYSSKLFGVLSLPLLSAGVWVLLLAVPFFTQVQYREQLQGTALRMVRFAVVLLFSTIHFASLFIALGHTVDMIMVVYYTLVLFFILLGNVIGTVRPNYFVGVRVPWTLNNEEVWRKTHRFTGRLWVAAGVLFFVAGASISSGNYATPLIVFIVLTSSIPLAYSYFIFQRQKA